ncbi:multidrug transporter [Agreia sp. COWG]|uniref:multidrug transporter n=1 Tax=Agreia sp. COWG TaxID=2773266 RepID=UPI0019269237|nr:multidrug transporter [Agreia sp. COWG]CAD6006157.1 protein of unknown function [Agreia sp. COWG]
MASGTAESSADASGASEMSAEEKRRDQLTTAPKSTDADAEPRIDVSSHDGVTRIDVRDDATVRPGSP